MRRSKDSEKSERAAAGREAAFGQNSAAAMNSDGSRKKIWLAVNSRRMQNVIEPAAHRRRAMARIGKRQEIGLEQPHDVRRDDDERDNERKPRPGRRKGAPRLPVEQHEQRIGRGQHDDEIFGP